MPSNISNGIKIRSEQMNKRPEQSDENIVGQHHSEYRIIILKYIKMTSLFANIGPSIRVEESACL